MPEILFDKFEITEIVKKDDYKGVYIANHLYLGKKIFLKSLNTENLPDIKIIERFKTEAKLLAKLEHPNIIKVFDFGTYQNNFYISFEYFESKNLRYYVSKGSLNNKEKRDIAFQIYDAINYAHKNNIVHRDIKPENILIGNDFNTKVTDFGLAFSLTDSLKTGELSILGTPSYMAPEQINGQKPSKQSDIFSLGILLFELYLGKNPFLGNDINSSLNNIVNLNVQKIPEIELVPEEIRKIITVSLKRKRAERFQNIDEIIEVLKLPNRKKEKPKNLFFILVLLILIVLLFILQKKGSDFWIENDKSEALVDSIPFKSLSEMNDSMLNEIPSKNGDSVSVDGFEQSNNKNLEPTNEITNVYGGFFVECIPWGEVYIDNKLIETTPLSSPIELRAGIYNLKLIHPDYPEYEGKIKINESDTLNLRVNLNEFVGYLHPKIYPWGLVSINGKEFGESPFAAPFPVSPGKYKITIKNPNFGIYVDSIKIKRMDTLIFQYSFQ